MTDTLPGERAAILVATQAGVSMEVEKLFGTDEWWIIDGITWTYSNADEAGSAVHLLITLNGVALWSFENFVALSTETAVFPPPIGWVLQPGDNLIMAAEGSSTAYFHLVLWGRIIGNPGPVVPPLS